MLISLAFLVFGGAILYVGAEWLVGGSAGLARVFGVKPLVIGLTVVAYGTSAPELAVSVAARIDGSSEIVIGNIVGSCIANLGLILGLTALLRPPAVASSLIRREVPVLIASAAVVPLLLIDGGIGAYEALGLLLASIVFTVWTLRSEARAPDPGMDVASVVEQAGAPGGDGKARLVLITAVGLALLIGGGEVFVRGAADAARALGLSEQLIGMTVVAVGTSLPELVTSLVAARRGESDLAIGNVVGSNIFNVLFILGVVPFIGEVDGTIHHYRHQLIFLIAITIGAALAMRGARRISRAEGSILLAAYVAFVAISALGG